MKKRHICIVLLMLLLSFCVGLSYSEDAGELVRIYKNKVKLEVNGQQVSADNFIYNSTTYVPLRAVSEILGKEVGWNAFTYVASINDKKYEKDQLSKLLPEKTPYTWIYNGFAEYGHKMTLTSITDEAQRRIYSISGEVGDPSGGESTMDRNISIKYVISGNSLVQEKNEHAMLDSKFDKITLIKTPLVAGTFWNEKLVDKYGKETTINSLITKVEITKEGFKQYTVRYEDTASDYYEERTFREGVGVVSVEKLLELKDSSFPVGYFLYVSGDLRTVQVTLYFPGVGGEKVYSERRSILIDDARVAQGAVQALIQGPSGADLFGSMPEGTRLLGISISNGICYVNFSREFIDNHPGGSAGELMTLGSIVNTLTEFDSIDSVQILVEGKTGETLGNILLDKPLERMDDLIGIK